MSRARTRYRWLALIVQRLLMVEEEELELREAYRGTIGHREMVLLVALVMAAAAVYAVAQVFKTVLPRLFLVPPHNWREKIWTVIADPRREYLQVGSKRSSFRRRLVLASEHPSFYTNFGGNRVKIGPLDSAGEDGAFSRGMGRREIKDGARKLVVGFFHPYANNGGGGERVLWQAVRATLLASDRHVVAVYTTNCDSDPALILAKTEAKFHIGGLDSRRIVFVYLRRFGRMIDGDYWKRFTLVGQLAGSALLALEAMYELSPDVWIDTIGLPGSYLPVSTVLRVPIMSYVHYPIIQPEMFTKLKFQQFSQIRPWAVRSVRDVLDVGKLMYWSGVYYLYVYLGSLVDITLTNGSWTFNHICNIWSFNKLMGHEIDILYPPCGTESLTQDVGLANARQNKLLFIAQFRPEKRHLLILHEYTKFLSTAKHSKTPTASIPTLVFLGSCRTPDDTQTLRDLQQEVEDLHLTGMVEFVVDCSYDDIIMWLSQVKFGLNAMWNEHFGIGVVEYLSRGVIPLCHASAGPLLDIVTSYNNELSPEPWFNNTGFFFKDRTDPDFNVHLQSDRDGLDFLRFADPHDATRTVDYPCFSKLLEELFISRPDLIADSRLQAMSENGVQSVLEKFSNNVFMSKWIKYVHRLDELEINYREERRQGIEKVY